ncbi:MAG: universal stress protein [Bacteroidia bacterium]
MKNILVPIDFSPQTEAALAHALIMAKKAQSEIILLHMVKSIDDRAGALSTLNQLAQKHLKPGVNIKTEVRVGPVEHIGIAAAELEVNLVYLGTHGLKGLQYLFGSKALQVITKSKSPYIIVQDAPMRTEIKNIVVPIDYIVEEKQILHPVINLAQVFGSRVHLFGAKYEDEFLKKKTELNLQYTKKMLDKHNLEYIELANTPKKNYLNDMLVYANAVQADLIAIINHKEDGYKNLFGTHFDQAVITNPHKIPVLVMNYKQIYKVVDLFTGIAMVS